MSDRIAIEVDDTSLQSALDAFEHVVLPAYMDAGALETAMNLQREARSRIKRAEPLTPAQQARPPLEDFVVVEKAKNGNGYVVIVKNPEGEFEGESLLLSWWLAAKWMHNRVPNPFLWAAQQVEAGPHRDRMLNAVQNAITDTGLGG